eukprot:7723567-Alexandrium_andersonii.AAC.1
MDRGADREAVISSHISSEAGSPGPCAEDTAPSVNKQDIFGKEIEDPIDRPVEPRELRELLRR